MCVAKQIEEDMMLFWDKEDRLKGEVIKITELSHHGEILQGIFEGEDKKLHRGLVTLKCNIYGTTAIFIKELGMNEIRVFPENKMKAKIAAEKTMKYIQKDVHYGGYLIIQGDVPEEWGFGSSTSNVVASIRAVASEFNIILQDKEIAQIAVDAECASDSIMFKKCVLFAQREGIVLDNYSSDLPPMHILGFNDGNLREGVNTLQFKPAEYSAEEIRKFKILRALFEKGLDEQNPELIGTVATASAKINQKYLPKLYFDELLKILRKSKGLGIQVAHSGNIVGFMYPDCIDIKNKCEEVKESLAQLGIDKIWSFNTKEINDYEKYNCRSNGITRNY